MDAHHATSAVAAWAAPSFDAGAEAWLRMRLAPESSAHRSAFGGAAHRLHGPAGTLPHAEIDHGGASVAQGADMTSFAESGTSRAR
jgi:hypothetical protein